MVALFNQLLAGGVIRGVKLLACSTYNQYDGICRFSLVEPTEQHIFNKVTNPLGVDHTLAAAFESAPMILEYKYSVDALVEEVEKEEKNDTDIGLVVASIDRVVDRRPFFAFLPPSWTLDRARRLLYCRRRAGQSPALTEGRPVQLHTYLNYGGNCEEAFKFYETHLGGRITMLMRHGEQPDATQVPAGWANAVLHARMNLGGTELLGADIPPDRFQPIRSAYLSLTLDSDHEADRVFALLSEDGQIFMPMQETFYATRFAMLRDRFGTSWMLLHPKPGIP